MRESLTKLLMPPADSILGVVSMMAALLALLSLTAASSLSSLSLLGGLSFTFAAAAPSPPLSAPLFADLSSAATADMARSLQPPAVVGSHIAAAADRGAHSRLQAKG